ncbi:hypothetical protein GFK91_09450 [Roseibium aggregatum]|uniref:hypothetical protein n=1 Tax=Roseibium aggregatum TaxID=187304 RepID=UPI001E64F259|nr:hypothetical protein [Roseibium aggregatum]UES55812.1 hypothetical protein GFK91_09450 [Roseibium aggregatum]
MDREEDQQRAMDALQPVLPVVYDILNESVSFYFSDAYSNEARAEHTDRAMANCIYSHAEKRMIGAADATDGLHTINVGGLHVLNYRDAVIARFKKVNANGKHSNYQTEQQKNYDDQKSLPGIPDPAFRLTAGYQLDDAGISLGRIIIARPLRRSIFWTAQVNLVDSVVSWEDITPKRFAGMEATDFDAERAGRRG